MGQGDFRSESGRNQVKTRSESSVGEGVQRGVGAGEVRPVEMAL